MLGGCRLRSQNTALFSCSGQYIVMRHLKKTVAYKMSFQQFADKFKRHCKIAFDDFFVSPGNDCMQEIEWAAGRRTSQAEGRIPQAPLDFDPADGAKTAWELCLTETEARYKDIYLSKVGPGKCYMLGQNPNFKVLQWMFQ